MTDFLRENEAHETLSTLAPNVSVSVTLPLHVVLALLDSGMIPRKFGERVIKYVSEQLTKE